MIHSFLITLLAGAAVASPVARQGVTPGKLYSKCTVPGTVAITFDDGPYEYTTKALDILDAAGFHGTFFMNGQNWDSIFNYEDAVKRVVNTGHQLGSHTWNHTDLTTVDNNGIDVQMTLVEDAMLQIVGVRPLWVRLPYLASNDAVLAELGKLGYAIADVSIDTKDYENTATPNVAIQNYADGLAAGGSISLMHDVYQPTVETVLPAIIALLKSKNLKSVTVGECLGIAPAAWYATGPRGGATTTTTTTKTTTTTTKTTTTAQTTTTTTAAVTTTTTTAAVTTTTASGTATSTTAASTTTHTTLATTTTSQRPRCTKGHGSHY